MIVYSYFPPTERSDWLMWDMVFPDVVYKTALTDELECTCS